MGATLGVGTDVGDEGAGGTPVEPLSPAGIAEVLAPAEITLTPTMAASTVGTTTNQKERDERRRPDAADPVTGYLLAPPAKPSPAAPCPGAEFVINAVRLPSSETLVRGRTRVRPSLFAASSAGPAMSISVVISAERFSATAAA